MSVRSKGRPYFEGWYLKQSSGEETVAFIPSLHRGEGGERCALIQVITSRGAWSFPIEDDKVLLRGKGFGVRMGRNLFTEKGIYVDLESQEMRIKGRLTFGELTKPAYDIMGPFAAVPGMECRHTVVSLSHTVSGSLFFNGKLCAFQNAPGYIEGDRGHSFPQRYAWTQSNFGRGSSLMLCAATVPLPWGFSVVGGGFTGCLGLLHHEGQETRFATYLGARVEKLNKKEIVVRQGNITLTACLLQDAPQPLAAPVGGMMGRTIHESAACKVWYGISHRGKIQMQWISDTAGFEFADAEQALFQL